MTELILNDLEIKGLSLYLQNLGGTGIISNSDGLYLSIQEEVDFINELINNAKSWLEKYGNYTKSDLRKYAEKESGKKYTDAEFNRMGFWKTYEDMKFKNIEKSQTKPITVELVLKNYIKDKDVINYINGLKSLYLKIDNIKTFDDLKNIGFKKTTSSSEFPVDIKWKFDEYVGEVDGCYFTIQKTPYEYSIELGDPGERGNYHCGMRNLNQVKHFLKTGNTKESWSVDSKNDFKS